MVSHSVVTFLQYGSGSEWFSDPITTDVRNPSQDVNQAPDRAVRFRYFCIAYAELSINMIDLHNVPAKSEPFHYSDVYYIDAEIQPISVVEDAVNTARAKDRCTTDRQETLLSNAKQCNIDVVIEARDGSMFTPHHRYALISSS